MADIVSPETRSRMMATIRGRDTKPEMLVRCYLHGLGFRYRLSPKELPGRPDLVLVKHQAIVFIHGCFWHGHHECRFAPVPSTRTDFWLSKITANRQRDKIAEEKLRAANWRVAVVWECSLRSKQSTSLAKLADFIESDNRLIEISE